MCGILGVYSFQGEANSNQFDKALKLIQHRGPDCSSRKLIAANVIFGHTRLSIIDLSTTNNQPFSVDDRYTLTYNGEVYNYLEIKEELKAKGIQFQTAGDTEVVLQSYMVWGEECVRKFNGMWAFAIYDKKLNKVFCSRDRFGVKPFVYYHSPDEFVFSSEIKPILAYKPEIKTPNYNMIANYVYKSIGAQAKETWFKDIYRLPPAHNLVVENGQIKMYQYWDYPRAVNREITFDEAKQKFEELFLDAVRIRMRSDVKVGSTLSSGLDSSSIVGVLNKLYDDEIETFTAYNPSESYTNKDKAVFKTDVELDESVTVKALTKEFNVKSNLIEVSFDDYLSKLSEAIYYLESGHSSPAIVSIHQVYKEARKKIKVLLEGQGADELLAGYIVDSFPGYLIENLKSGKFRKAVGEYNAFRNVYSTSYLVLMYLRSFDNAFFNNVKNSLMGIDVLNKEAFTFKYIKDNTAEQLDKNFDHRFNTSLFRKHTSGLVNLLHYGDALSMAESIECRLPFMDYRLVEFAFTLPYNFKLNKMQGKYIQRKALEAYVPEYITNSTLKIGFATPLDKLMNDPKIEEILLVKNCGNLFDNPKIQKLLRDHKDGKGNHSTLLFRILSAKIWYATFFENA
jgi:asparagine synthase (glutamine-hydrolysing)